MDYPRLRYGLEAIPVDHQGQKMAVLHDRLGYCNSQLLVSPVLLELLVKMDGQNSVLDLQAHYTQLTGHILFRNELEEVLQRLDESLFLENERFAQFVAGMVAAFRKDPIRKMAHAGKSYAEEPELLKQQLTGFFDVANGGPGFPEPGSTGRRILGLVAPHIDMQAGGPTFAHAYKAACEGLSPETWVVLGTGHEMVENYFALTEKDFETPLGLVLSDDNFCRELIARAPRDLQAGEYGHRKEHTIEFQAVFMAAFQPRARIVPILCSFSLEEWEADRKYIDEMALLLREIAFSSQSSVGFIASVDLAHIGPRYGGRFKPNGGTITEHMAADRLLLESLEKTDALEFMQKINQEGNRRNVCGVAPLYVLAKILEGRASGRMLHHSHAIVDGHNSFVTFASMVFEEAGKG